MAAAAVDPYSSSATGLLGDKRESMLQNQLLLRVSLHVKLENKVLMHMHDACSGASSDLTAVQEAAG